MKINLSKTHNEINACEYSWFLMASVGTVFYSNRRDSYVRIRAYEVSMNGHSIFTRFENFRTSIVRGLRRIRYET